MALATRCPACGTIFRISTIQAAAKSGMVRCGTCRHVFNSLDALVRVEDLEPEPETPCEHDTSALADGGDADAPIGGDNTPAAVNESGTFKGSEPKTRPHQTLSEEGPSLAAAHALHEGGDEATAATPHPPDDVAHEDPPTRIGARRLDLEWPKGESAPVVEPSFMHTAGRPARSTAERAVLAILSMIAALGLVAQSAYVWRDELAARWPAVRPALLAACVPLRCVVSLPARLDAIKIVASSLQNAPGNRDAYVATVLLRNYAHVGLQLPAIELTLTDTQDRPLVRRVFRPGDYLPQGAVSRSGVEADGIAADSELPVRIVFEVAGLRVAGFYFDRFYP